MGRTHDQGACSDVSGRLRDLLISDHTVGTFILREEQIQRMQTSIVFSLPMQRLINPRADVVSTASIDCRLSG